MNEVNEDELKSCEDFNEDEELKACTDMIDSLKAQIKEYYATHYSNGKVLQSVSDYANEIDPDFHLNLSTLDMKKRYSCNRHFGKIYTLFWSSNSKFILTGAQDGKCIIWSSDMDWNQHSSISLSQTWIMTCAISPSLENIACAGFNNCASVFKMTSDMNFESKHPISELQKHEGFVSCVRFMTDNEILTASGDLTCMLWDIEHRTVIRTFSEHSGDVSSLDIHPQSSNIFISGSLDGTARIWDCRTSVNESVCHFSDHTFAVNCVSWFAEHTIITGDDGGLVHMFDMRTIAQMNIYETENNLASDSMVTAGVTSVDASLSGRFIFCAYENENVIVWNSITAEKVLTLSHDARVSSLMVSPDGCAVATGTWDFKLSLFA